MRSLLKQILALGVVLGIGLMLWVRFFPGAGAVLERFGLGAVQVQAGEAQTVAGQKPGGPAGAAAAGGAGAGRGGRGPRVATVVVKPAGSEILNDKVQALGTASARSSVTVVPRGAGLLTQVMVGSGTIVAAGDPLAKLDAEAEQIAFDKTQLAYDDAMRSLSRNAALVKSQAVAEAQSQAVQLAASVAELNLRTAKSALSDRSITAPIAGVVGIVDVNAGSEVTPQTVIARIEDATVLRVDFWLPERLSGQVATGGQVDMVAVARPQEVLTGRIMAVDNQVDAASGTFRVQAELDNAKGSLRPGMALTVSLNLVGQSYVSVDPLAVQWGSDGAYVWRVVDGKADKAKVRIVQRNTETVLVAGDVAAGDAVIAEGLDGLKAGAQVKIFGAPDPAQAGADAAADDAGTGGKAVKRGDKAAAAAGN